MRHLLTLLDVSPDEIQEILRITSDLKAKFVRGNREPLLPGRVLGLLFSKPSLRTRVSFEAAMAQLGGASLYLGKDVGWAQDQRRELEAIFSGKNGGHLESLWGATIDEWLPAKVSSIAISWGEKPTLSVNGIGRATMRPLSDGAGKLTIVTGAMSQAGLQIDSMNLASSDGSLWSDPDFRSWEGSSGNIHEFDWNS